MVASLGLGLILFLSAARDVAREIRAAWQFAPYPEPYKATVVGFETRYGRHTSTAPIVEVEPSAGAKFRFTSSRYSVLQTIASMERVRLVTRPTTNAFGQPSAEIEIDNAYHLWLGDLLALLMLPGAILIGWIWVRLSPAQEGRYKLPP